jgi:hypothetical protein
MAIDPSDPDTYDPRVVNAAIRERLKLDASDTRFFGPAAPVGARERDPRWYTATGVFLSDGLIVVDYDMKVSRFSWAEQDRRARMESEYWDGWFSVNGSLMNGERLGTIDPLTRRPLSEADAERGTLPPRA